MTTGMWLCFPWVPGLPSRKTDIRELLAFGTHLAGANIVASIAGAMDRVLLGRFRGPAPVAMYRQAYQLLVTPMDQLLSPVYQVTQPGLSLLQTDPQRFRRFYEKVLTVVGLATMPLSAFVALYSTEITRVLLGRRWIDSAPILTILSLGTFIKQPVGSAAFVLVTRGRSKTYFALASAQNVTLVLLMLIGVHWGSHGVAFADVATTYLLMVPNLYFCLKDSPISVAAFFSTVGRPAVASVAMALGLLLLRQALPNVRMSVSLGLGCVAAPIMLVGFLMLVPGGRNELLALMSDVRSALQRKVAGVRPVEAVAVTS